jgi:outer membrane protein assembly factor BamB
MPAAQTAQPIHPKPLRLWPGAVAAALLFIVGFVYPLVVPGGGAIAIFGGLAGAFIVLLWWLFFSRAPWVERLGAIVLAAVALFVTSRLVDESIAGGMMGMMPFIFGIPLLSLALAASVVLSRHLSSGLRRASIAVAILLACGAMTLVRTGGLSGDADLDLHFRWTPTPEERLLAQDPLQSAPSIPVVGSRREPAASPEARTPETPAALSPTETPEKSAEAEPAEVPTAPAEKDAAAATPDVGAPTVVNTAADWPGFRGPRRNGVVGGVQIETNWTASPPTELWRRPIGPGWSSFAVSGDLIYTQEQRGDEEVVACYRLTTGEPVWRHRNAARFWESNGGAGPRGTPTLSNGRVYSLGATGILNALDAASGAVVWSRNAASDTGREIPAWGFSSSPLVVDDMVVVATAGDLVAYDAATGERRWLGPKGGWGYSSPHLITIDGVPQILLLNGTGAVSVAPSDGTVLWQHEWPSDGIVQPGVTAEGDVLIGSGSGLNVEVGVRRISVGHGSGAWTVQERWTSAGLKPYFNDFVVHEGHAFGFDGSILACIDLRDGVRKWKGGRYGHGQLVVLPEQDLLLVLSEEGELALVSAAPDKFNEVARFRVIEGKTWNHPVLVRDVLLARNGEEMVAFRLPVAGH